MCSVCYASVAVATDINAPTIIPVEADNIVITDGFLSSLSNRKGINLNDTKWIVRQIMEKYGLGEDFYETMYNLAECESSFNSLAWNKNDPNGGSFGLFQYQIPTFYHYAKVYGIKNPDIWNVQQQIELTVYLISDNKITLWTCGQKYGNSYKE